VVVGVAVDSIDDCVHHHLHMAIVNRRWLLALVRRTERHSKWSKGAYRSDVSRSAYSSEGGRSSCYPQDQRVYGYDAQ
jgi:hypothetical protein